MSKKTVHDIILVAAVLLVAGSIYMYTVLPGRSTASSSVKVVVRVDGEVYGEYPLNSNKVIDLSTERGSNKIIINDSNVWMEDADCPDKVCVKTGKIKSPGQTVVCLPHRVVIEIKGDNADIDAAV
ncbi:MAG: NusG domain II-containing protein [Clostridia bacterium]|nr:NusG domain II-containing protein [[Bacteroides] pectinophilus]MDD5872120.1 NusG domain II-containing protein [Clostridia bacterium]